MILPAPTSYKNNLIIPIAVMPPLVPGGEPQLVCPSFILPLGEWLLVWNLVTIIHPELSRATFADKGIVPMLGQTPNFSSSFQTSDTQWVCSISNESKEEVSKAYPFFYVVRFRYPQPGQGNDLTVFTSEDRAVIDHDPTIVVSQDPAEPV